jgi:coproporphyrinogen III oxidase
VTALMPQDEVRNYAALYAHIEDVANAFAAVWPTIVRASLQHL